MEVGRLSGARLTLSPRRATAALDPERTIHCLFFQRLQLAGADIIRQFVVEVTGTSIVLPPEAILDCGIGPWPRHDDHIASPKFGAI